MSYRVKFDHSKLIGKMAEKKLTRGQCAKQIGIDGGTFALKLKGDRQFNQSEIIMLAELLNISDEEIAIYFFTPETVISQ